MRVLVIGGRGFIGEHLVDQVVERDCDVVVLDLNERRYDPLPSETHFEGDLDQASLGRERLTGVEVAFHLNCGSPDSKSFRSFRKNCKCENPTYRTPVLS